MFSRIAMTTVAILLCGLFAPSVMGQPRTPNSNQPDAAEIVKRMKQVLKPSRMMINAPNSENRPYDRSQRAYFSSFRVTATERGANGQ
jgi:hypothetical protein